MRRETPIISEECRAAEEESEEEDGATSVYPFIRCHHLLFPADLAEPRAVAMGPLSGLELSNALRDVFGKYSWLQWILQEALPGNLVLLEGRRGALVCDFSENDSEQTTIGK